MFLRTQTRTLSVGGVAVGGGAPVTVQTMADADPHDAAALTRQVESCAAAGADIVRLTVPDVDSARVLGEVRRATPVPLVADIHFDWRCALAALEAGADALRLNPGNIGGAERIREVARVAEDRRVPIRVGVNGGSLERDLLEKFGGATAEALVESAVRSVGLLEAEGFRDVAVSVKASDVRRTIDAYRMLAERTDCPLHLGVTEAGTLLPGTVRSAVALGILLEDGIGDTLRVSLTDAPEREAEVGVELLRALGLREPGVSVTSCPTCGRTRVDVAAVAGEVERSLARSFRGRRAKLRVAVMGCAVNGPGEARDADVALCGGDGEFVLFVGGRPAGKVSPDRATEAVLSAAEEICARKEKT